MLEALRSVEFESNMGEGGGGVVVFETGRVFGGDGQYYYVGNFAAAADGKTGSGEIKVTNYSGQPYSFFGHLTEFSIKVSGPIAQDTMVLTGELVDNPSLKMQIWLTRLAELPTGVA